MHFFKHLRHVSDKTMDFLPDYFIGLLIDLSLLGQISGRIGRGGIRRDDIDGFAFRSAGGIESFPRRHDVGVERDEPGLKVEEREQGREREMLERESSERVPEIPRC